MMKALPKIKELGKIFFFYFCWIDGVTFYELWLDLSINFCSISFNSISTSFISQFSSSSSWCIASQIILTPKQRKRIVTIMLVIVGEISFVIISPNIVLSTVIIANAPQAPKKTINLLYLIAIIIAKKNVLSPIQLTKIAKKDVVKPESIPALSGACSTSVKESTGKPANRNKNPNIKIISCVIIQDINNREMYFIITILIFLQLCDGLDLLILKPELESEHIVFLKDELQYNYNDSQFNNELTCKNGGLEVLSYNIQNQEDILLSYKDSSLSQKINIEVWPNKSPYPTSSIDLEQKEITIHRNCPKEEQVTEDNYFNKISITLTEQQTSKNYTFSFLLNCDDDNRHKKFEFGYFLIAVLNAIIIIGVALYSRIWSIRYNGHPLTIELNWKRFLVLTIILIALSIALFVFAKNNEFLAANSIIQYVGLFLSLFFVFICFDEIFYLRRQFKKPIYKRVRICDVISFVLTLTLMIISLFVENWILYNALAIFICVGAIKLLKFLSLKQAFFSFLISVLSSTILAIILHFLLPQRSYNDYASEISSPIFITLPDLINNLYKKCSWLPVIDVIVPGVLLSFLRKYDQNFNTGWGGVYTIVGNLSFIFSTGLWMIIQALYPFSIPFSLITYTFLFLSIVLVSFRRNELKTLWDGRFYREEELSDSFLKETERISFDKLVDKEIIETIKGRASFSDGDQQK